MQTFDFVCLDVAKYRKIIHTKIKEDYLKWQNMSTIQPAEINSEEKNSSPYFYSGWVNNHFKSVFTDKLFFSDAVSKVCQLDTVLEYLFRIGGSLL